MVALVSPANLDALIVLSGTVPQTTKQTQPEWLVLLIATEMTFVLKKWALENKSFIEPLNLNATGIYFDQPTLRPLLAEI